MLADSRYPSEHPIITCDRECVACELGRLREEHNLRALEREEMPQKTVPGNGPEDLTRVRLIVLSDYPGIYEVQEGYPMVNRNEKKAERSRGKVVGRNAGALLRGALHAMYGLDTYNDVWITNAIKCGPNKNTVLEKHIKRCAQQWLSAEMTQLDHYCPTAPLLVMGTHAFRAVKVLYAKSNPEFAKLGLTGVRRKIHYIGERPVVFSFNPAIAARSEPRIESLVKNTKRGKVITRTEWLYPPLPGSPVDRLIGDLSLLNDVLQ